MYQFSYKYSTSLFYESEFNVVLSSMPTCTQNAMICLRQQDERVSGKCRETTNLKK
jgi:hypothetical protein